MKTLAYFSLLIVVLLLGWLLYSFMGGIIGRVCDDSANTDEEGSANRH